MVRKKFVGVDGCKAGWFAVCIDQNSRWETGICSKVGEVLQAFEDSDLILIDIPIGLPSGKPRTCDTEARRLLGRGRGSLVFPPPCREALCARDYQQACEINKRVLGKRLSKQSWMIGPRIKEVDDFLSETREARNSIRESHPELCFQALAGGSAMRHRKKIKEGFLERLDLLKSRFSETESLVKSALEIYRRKGVAQDDILDALVLAVTASRPLEELVSIPEPPEKDRLGLPMEIVFAGKFQTLNDASF
jgi:predicted RNase H-like nuclease